MAKNTKTTYRTIHPSTGEEVTFTKGGRPILWITWGDFDGGEGFVHFGYSSQADHAKAVKAPRSTNPYAARYAATAATVVSDEQPEQAPAAPVVEQAAPVEQTAAAEIVAIQDEQEAAQDDADATIVTVDLVTPTKGLILSGEHAGTVLHAAKREQRPGAGWEAENEYGETAARGMSCLEAAVTAWAMAEGLTGRLSVIVSHEYQQTGQRDG